MRLVTFNILNGRSTDDGLVDLDRYAAAVRSLDADLLALQEVDRGQQRSGGADLAAIAAGVMGATDHRFAAAITGTPGGSRAVATDDGDGGGAAYGVALLSRHPVQSWQVVRLPALPVPAPWVWSGTRRPVLVHDEPRVAIVATLTSPLGVLTVATTHLSYLPGWNVVQLRRLAATLRGTVGPVVLMGDLNMGRRRAERCSGLSSTCVALTFPAVEPTRQIDHVLGRGLPGRATGEARRLPLSDHRALVVEVTAPALA